MYIRRLLIPTKENGHIGVADMQGKVIIRAGFDGDGPLDKKGEDLFLGTVNKLPLYVNSRNKVIWMMKTDTTKRPWNVSRKEAGDFVVNAEQPETGGRYYRYGIDRPIPAPVTASQTFAPAQIQVIVRTDTTVSYGTNGIGYPVFVANTTDSITLFSVQGGRLYMVMQAFQNNQWKDIEYLPSSWCGNAYGNVALKPQKYWQLICAQYTGAIKTDLRIRLSSSAENGFTVYSNVFKGSINPGQLWRTSRYYSDSIMYAY